MDQVARGERQLSSIKHPVEREAVRIALRLHADRPAGPDQSTRARMRDRVLRGVRPRRPTLSDRIAFGFEMLARPAPYLVRGLAVVAVVASLAAGATVASADTLPDDPLYAVKLASEEVRLALATTAEDRAAIELSIAEHRLAEAERLAASGRVDDALVTSSSYSEHVARAAAQLARLEPVEASSSSLVSQLDSRFAAQRTRVLSLATKLVSDPATASSARVLATVAEPSLAPGRTQAERVAETAATVAQDLAHVAEVRALEAPAANGVRKNDVIRRTDSPRATEAARSDAPRSTPARRAETPRTTESVNAGAPAVSPEGKAAAPEQQPVAHPEQPAARQGQPATQQEQPAARPAEKTAQEPASKVVEATRRSADEARKAADEAKSPKSDKSDKSGKTDKGAPNK